jgi:hypothetical protein
VKFRQWTAAWLVWNTVTMKCLPHYIVLVHRLILSVTLQGSSSAWQRIGACPFRSYCLPAPSRPDPLLQLLHAGAAAHASCINFGKVSVELQAYLTSNLFRYWLLNIYALFNYYSNTPMKLKYWLIVKQRFRRWVLQWVFLVSNHWLTNIYV